MLYVNINMPIKKPDSKIGLQDALWMAFVFGFLIMVFTSCNHTPTKRDRLDHHRNVR